MRNIEGLYTAISAIINQKEDEARMAIRVSDVINEVKNEVDVYSASLDWYIQFALRAAVEVGLYKKGYRAVVKGKGLFVNLEHCNNPDYLARLFNNAKLSEQQKKQVVDIILKQAKSEGVYGQFDFEFDENGECKSIVEGITEQKLLEMLEADAGDEMAQ